MGRAANPGLAYDWLRPLMAKARDKIGLEGALREAGIEGRNAYKAVHRWLEGWVNGKGERRYRAVSHEVGLPLLRYLRDKYPTEFIEASKKEASRWIEEQEAEAEVMRLEERLKSLKEKGRNEPML
jgi:hypothetical protein